MDIKTIALAMYPSWLLGAFMIFACIKVGKKELVRIDKVAMKKWCALLLIITLYRILLFKMFPNFSLFKEAAKNVSVIPWPMTLTVFWEDACHGLPLLLIKEKLNKGKLGKVIYRFILTIAMIEFGLGHIYQGAIAAIALSMYIPYSMNLGKKYGFGTVMLAHTLYDLTTILSVKLLLG